MEFLHLLEKVIVKPCKTIRAMRVVIALLFVALALGNVPVPATTQAKRKMTPKQRDLENKLKNNHPAGKGEKISQAEYDQVGVFLFYNST